MCFGFPGSIFNDIFGHCIEQSVFIDAVIVAPWPFIHHTDCAHTWRMFRTYAMISCDHRCLPKLGGVPLGGGPHSVVCGGMTHMSSI